MNYAKMYCLGIVLALTLSALWGCPKKAEVIAVPDAPKNDVSATTTQNGDTGNRESPVANPEGKGGPAERSSFSSAGFTAIYFDYDKSFIRNDATDVMQANAERLKANPRLKIRIEGNCDDRGTKEYNQALGQRRAVSARTFLTKMGIPANRISLVSYGKEKPVCTDSTEDCRQKNRRDDFVVVEE
jgi:peptidoglycan-associated lipoprotein